MIIILKDTLAVTIPWHPKIPIYGITDPGTMKEYLGLRYIDDLCHERVVVIEDVSLQEILEGLVNRDKRKDDQAQRAS